MKRRILLIVLGVVLLFHTAVFAQPAGFATPSQYAKVYVAQSDNATGDYTSTDMSTISSISVGSRILGFTIVPYDAAAHSELMVGFWDSITDEGVAFNELIAEAEVLNGYSTTEWFPFGLSVVTKLQVHQGANTTILIYHTK